MDLSTFATTRMLCAEALEGRCMLSAAVTAPADPATAAPPDYKVIDYDPNSEEPDDDVEIDEEDLPAAVASAFFARFPGARIDAAERETDTERGQTEYGIEAELDGQTIDVSLTPAGSILEVERFISEDKLPQAIRDWYRDQGFEIEEAAEVEDWSTGTRRTQYEILSTGGGEETPVERLMEFVPPKPSVPPVTGGNEGEEPAPTPEPSGPATPPSVPRGVFAAGGELPVAAGGESEPLELVEGEAARDAATAITSEDAAPARAGHGALTAETHDGTPAAVAVVPSGPANRVTRALEALATGAGAGVWLPEVAGVLVDVLPINVAGVEDGLDAVLSEIDALAAQVLDETDDAAAAVGSSTTARLATLAALVAGAQLVLLRIRGNKGGPVLMFSAANSSWSWILGAGTTKQD